jgi:hypothetical protein
VLLCSNAQVLKPVYNAKRITKDDFKVILKKASAKVLERQTAAEKLLSESDFLTAKRKSKVRATSKYPLHLALLCLMV